MTPRTRSALSLVLTVLFWTSSARGDVDGDRARALYVTGTAAFDAGRYDDALQSFRSAYLLSRAAGLLFNMGVALERSGKPHEAAEELRAYLRATPASPDLTRIEARIRGLDEAQRLLDTERLAKEPLLLRAVVIENRQRRRFALGLGLGIGIGAAVVVAGVTLGLEFGLRPHYTTATLGTQRATP